MASHDYSAAIQEYRMAYKWSELQFPNDLYNIAEAQRVLKNKTEAIVSYQSYLVRTEPWANAQLFAEQRRRAQKFVEALESDLAQERRRYLERQLQKPLWRHSWFWGGLGLGSVSVIALGLGLGLGLQQAEPLTTIRISLRYR